MNTRWQRRVTLLLALGLAATPCLLSQAGGGNNTVELEGKVVPLTALLAKDGIKLDADAKTHWLALATQDGKIYPLIKDEGARMFYTDPKLQDRPMRLSGRLWAKSQLLQVLTVRSVHNGKLHEVYYWCDICAIRRNVQGICECCGGPMELRDPPLK